VSDLGVHRTLARRRATVRSVIGFEGAGDVMDEALKATGTGLVALLVGWLLFQLQEGTRRRRLRQRLRDELEILELLPMGIHRQRQMRRVDLLTEEYLPGDRSEPIGSDVMVMVLGSISAAAVFLGAGVLSAFGAPIWFLVPASFMCGVVALTVVIGLFERWWRQKALDGAV